ncbi:MAG: hypothetical protein WEC37_05275 [Anaerolineales bacterium]
MLESKVKSITVLLGALVVLLTACAPSAPVVNADEQVASAVAGTLAAQSGPTATSQAAPVVGEATPEQDVFGSCANTGQISLAYTRDGNIWLWVEGGVKTQLTNSGDAGDLRISQDGCRIAYARALPNPAYDPNAEFPTDPTFNELWVVSSDGSLNQQLAGAEFLASLPQPPDSGLTVYQFDWQPGTHVVAFNTEVLGFGLSPSDDIHLANANTLSVSTLLPAGQGGAFYFSPDGQQIAFSTSTTVNTINVDGSNLRPNLVSFPFVITYSEYAYYPPISWSPTSDTLMVAIPPEDGLAAPVNGVYPETALWWLPLDGTPPFQPGAVQNIWLALSEVQFSPDNGRVAYLRPIGAPETNQRELVIALSDGSNESTVIQLPEITFGDWSSDSSQFIYYYRDPNLHFYLGNVGDPNVVPISTLTPFVAGGASIEWLEADTFVLLLVGSAGSELSIMQTSGAGMVVDTFAEPFVSFDLAH